MNTTAFRVAHPASRLIRLEAADYSGAVRFLTGLHVKLEQGRKTSWVTVTRTGTFTDPRYGEFNITRELLLAMVANFDARVYGQDVFIDVSHQPDQGAAGRIQKLAVEGDRLRAQVEWTDFGVEAIAKKGFSYLSAEYHENWQDNEQGARHGPVLLGAALTVRPVIKRLDPIALSEADTGDKPTLAHPELAAQLSQEIRTMWKDLIKRLQDALGKTKLSEKVVAPIVAAAEKALATVTDKEAAEALIAQFEASGKQLAEQIGDQVIQLDIKIPEPKKTEPDKNAPKALTAEDVKLLLAEEQQKQADALKKLADTKAAKVKLLADTINAATGLDDELKKQLADEHKDLITGEMTDAQVESLASSQIKHGNELIAARTLAQMGYERAGTPHITVDASNAIKGLQEKIDARLKLSERSLEERYPVSGGVAVARNKPFVEKVLAEFDARNGARLNAEHKALAGGSGIVSDMSIPAWWERTVIREALYDLVSLSLMDVGTAGFHPTILIPFSYRDTTGAGRDNVRVYENQPIPRAGIKQEMDEARPIPQKLAFLISEEMMRLAANGQLADWDAVIENQRNASRIVAEDTERLNMNEILAASDRFANTAVVDEAVASGDGTKTIFVLDNFPVVRPQKVYDLQGNQVGSTLYPVVITVDATPVVEWDGTGDQSAGMYYVLDYELGEIHFVDEAGDPAAVTNTEAIVASYSYTTNVFKFDTDLPDGVATDAHWDSFLYRFGLRKAVIEDQRFYSANIAIMSGTVRTTIEQARQFGANFKRMGTDLLADGNLGRIKDVPSFKSRAPGLHMGDTRVVIGQRAVSRFRMCKPWMMSELQDARDTSTGQFIGAKEAYGTQWIVSHTPEPLRQALTSIALYSADARVDR